MNIDPTNLTCFEATKASDSTNESDPNAGDGAGDAFADYQKSYGADISVDGVGDVWNQPIVGNFNQLNSLSLFEAANSITSALANEFGEAAPGLHQASLIYLGLVLFLITFVVLSISKMLLQQLKKREGLVA